MPDVFGNFKPPRICLEVQHLPERRKGRAAGDGLRRAQKHKHARLPVKLDSHLLISGHAHARTRTRTHVWGTLDAIRQSVTHDGVSRGVQIDVGSRREWLPDRYQEPEWPAATLLLRRRLKEGMRFQLGEWVVRTQGGGAVFRERLGAARDVPAARCSPSTR